MKDVDKEKDFLRFQTQRKITNLYKGFLIILEDMKASGYDIPEEYYQRIRKRVLDQGNDAIREMEEFYERFEKLCKVLLENKDMFGYCYTQLTDIDQEENGIYKYDRSLKFNVERLRKIQTVTAAIEI